MTKRWPWTRCGPLNWPCLFIESQDKNAFLADIKTQSSAPHQLLLPGEAVKRLSDDFRKRHAGVPCKQIAGMRDHLIHRYDAVDLEEVWKTVTVDLPVLAGALERLAPKPPPL